MNYRALITLPIAAAIMLTACSKGGDISKSSQVLARVGDKEITTTYFDRQVSNLPESVQKLSTQGEGKKAILDAFVNRELLYTEALNKKVDKGVELQQKIEDMRKEMVINAYLQKEITGKITVDDKEVANFYNANPGEFQHREEVRISQIVVPDEAKAQDMLQKLSIRREFGELAEAHSTDKESAARRGDVGWFTRKRLPENVRDSVFSLRVGEVSKPFKMADGYEIYKITDRRVTSYPFEKVKDAIKAQLYNDKLQNELKTLVAGLKKETKIQVNEALLK